MSLFREIFLFSLFPALSMAQWVSVGVTGGVPLSPQSHQFAPGFVLSYGPVPGPNDLVLKPYFVGGTVQVRLRWKFSVVGEIEYSRMHEDFTYFDIKNPVDLGTRGGASANVLLFPLLVRYDFGLRRISPFVDVGATLRRLGPFNGSDSVLMFNGQFQTGSFHIVPGENPEIALTAGAGVRTRLALFDLLSEVRFLHWTTGYYTPAQNQAVLSVSVLFPAKR